MEEQKSRKISIQDGTVAGLRFSSEDALQKFIQIMEGRCSEQNIVIRIDVSNQKENSIDYKKLIDVIVAEKKESTLSCQEYIYLYCMIRKGFQPSIKVRLEKMLIELQITELREQKVGTLSKGQYCIIRSLAAYLQGCRVLVLKNPWSICTEDEKKVFYRFCKQFLACKGIVLFLSTSEMELNMVTAKIYNMDEK